MKKVECIFKSTEAPQVIQARLWSIEASPVTFYLRGQGTYPYECQSKDDYPDAYIYFNESGGWVGSYQLELQEDGSYLIR